MALSFIKLVGLVLAASCTAAADGSLQERQLHSLPDQGSSSSSIATTTSSSSSTITRGPSTMKKQAGPLRWELTTVFTQPDECEGGITQYAGDLSTLGYWLNIPHPAPGLTLTSCFPPALVASATASVDQPPYSQLVCPYRWQAVDFNSTYRVCCPHDYRIYAPAMVGASTLPDRPGLGAWCTSWVQAGKFALLTVYDNAGGSSVVETTLGDGENWLVQATAFDGTIATNVPTSTTTSSTSTPKSTDVTTRPTKTTTTRAATTTTTTTPATTSSAGYSGPTALGAMPSCGQTCIGNMLNKYKELGCGPLDIACACRAPNFNYGVRDCATAACTADEARTVISFETSYWCPSYMATGTNSPKPTPTPTAISQLPTCGQTCMNNMIGQYTELGCHYQDPACLCKNANFGYGVRDCANGACGSNVASTVIAFESAYCSSAAATPTPVAFHVDSRYHNDCTGDTSNSNDVMMYQEGLCINTNCQVASLNLAAVGNCPDGEIQISYWEQPDCQGKWFGYGYAKRGTCRPLWTDGWKFKALHLRCAKQAGDCVSTGECTADPEPSQNVC
ncbi:hypothetical protein LMH87_000004 [Akanthomyces muscarius]|uniref:CFEM domain-containing protein n=1 Tax=Akanthomyces muscarius TaxID=2231603 RepID=A0A9W8QDP7_AKAMU|nr:hypothetical protein LMH87_000004 [Akanthomyces muscarius]KAJ4154724.1 hypothetical protein LMH87_000004 [Akanthomyces muscarius]